MTAEKKTVLVADDESHIAHVVAMKLQQAGLRVLTAADGEEAYDLACSALPDLVVTDFQMPIMSGLQLATRLRQNASTAAIPVLVVTARGHLLTDEDLARTSVKAVICKPFSPRHLLEKVQELLRSAEPLSSTASKLGPDAGAVAA